MRRSRRRRNRSVYGVRIDDKRSLRARPGLDGGHDVALFGVDEIAVRVLLRLKRLGLAVYLDVEGGSRLVLRTAIVTSGRSGTDPS